MNIKAVVEGLIFVSGEDGITLDKLIEITEKSKDEINNIIKELFNDYNNDSHGIQIEFLGNNFKFTTKCEHKDFYKKLICEEKNSSLSQSSLETLAIIAYNGPVTRIQIDEIRGINSTYVVRKLLIKGLIEEVGKAETAGKPKIYNITSKFLDYFGLGTVEDLPKMAEKNIDIENSKDTDLFTSKYSE